MPRTLPSTLYLSSYLILTTTLGGRPNTIIIPINRCRNQGKEKIKNLLKITEQLKVVEQDSKCSWQTDSGALDT